MWQLQANMQQRIERERKELEQGHVRIIKEYESRVRDLDSTNRVSTRLFIFVECINTPPLIQLSVGWQHLPLPSRNPVISCLV